MTLQDVIDNNLHISFTTFCSDEQLIINVQRKLWHLRLLTLPLKNRASITATMRALHNFQKLTGLPVTEIINADTAMRLLSTTLSDIPEVLRIR